MINALLAPPIYPVCEQEGVETGSLMFNMCSVKKCQKRSMHRRKEYSNRLLGDALGVAKKKMYRAPLRIRRQCFTQGSGYEHVI